MKRCRGVYERQPGRWAAEFRSHRLKARHWIGTFATEDEAKAAYDDFERQFFPARRCGLPVPLPALERGGGRAAGGVQRASNPHRQRHPHPPDKRQIVLALAATGIMLPPLPSAPASAPCISNPTSATPQRPLVPPPPFENNAEPHGDAVPSVHSFWADEPADEDLIGLADLGHLPLPFSDGSMDFDPDDLSLFDGFL
ncbi:hypothetical protein BDA96_07G113600 [Sorghum bicolor]|jgi:hypothetical protein|uniref:AP2/ERF domain-containing protein n=2 Tax=Sorghum bicolor TaxID=4558 RepID=A0A921QMK8_SORBI|nr:hypothetical protein BDA96_07G113600 [Sorghum bicolor]KXG24987.1 hypothetical protein SORBI_3007G107400 [Sorghum bicolor]